MLKRRITVDRLSLDELPESYDLVLCAVGYESRARYFAERFSPQAEVKLACAFDAQHHLAYEANSKFYQDSGFAVEEVNDSAFAVWIEAALVKAVQPTKGKLRMVADISSLSRVRIAHLVSALIGSSIEADIHLSVVYSLALYTAPSSDTSPNSHVGPVTSAFAGWWSEPDRQLSAVVGFGYEQEKALGAVEYLEAEDVWAFRPSSVIPEYTSALQIANEGLLGKIKADHVFEYRVEDPLACLAKLRSLVLGLISQSNVVLLPFGPKIFALCCLLLAASLDEVAVWRVSAQDSEVPVDRRANGEVYGLDVRFERSSQSTF